MQYLVFRHTLGKNLISAFLFFIPRKLWSGKSEATGSIVVRFLGSNQSNVSTPLIAEYYAAFGILGLIILGFITGKIIKKFDQYADSNNLLMVAIFCLLNGMSMYILRGSLLVSIAYTSVLSLSIILTFFVCKIVCHKYN